MKDVRTKSRMINLTHLCPKNDRTASTPSPVRADIPSFLKKQKVRTPASETPLVRKISVLDKLLLPLGCGWRERPPTWWFVFLALEVLNSFQIGFKFVYRLVNLKTIVRENVLILARHNGNAFFNDIYSGVATGVLVLEPLFLTAHLVTFIWILQNLYFIYPIFSTFKLILNA